MLNYREWPVLSEGADSIRSQVHGTKQKSIYAPETNLIYYFEPDGKGGTLWSLKACKGDNCEKEDPLEAENADGIKSTLQTFATAFETDYATLILKEQTSNVEAKKEQDARQDAAAAEMVRAKRVGSFFRIISSAGEYFDVIASGDRYIQGREYSGRGDSYEVGSGERVQVVKIQPSFLGESSVKEYVLKLPKGGYCMIKVLDDNDSDDLRLIRMKHFSTLFSTEEEFEARFQKAIDSAKIAYVGKDIWLTERDVTFRRVADNARLDGEVKMFSKFRIKDVRPSYIENEPTRLILQDAKGDSLTLRKSIMYSDFPFSFSDPKAGHKWSKKVWDAIENGEVYVGLTKEQARMSWGEPEKINTTTTKRGSTEQWVYKSGSYLYFDGNLLTTIQN